MTRPAGAAMGGVPGAAGTERSRAFPPAWRLFDWGLALVVMLLMTISPLALLELGINYGEAGGSPIEKIHPGTLLAALMLVLAAATRGNPLRWIGDTAHATPAIIVYVGAIGLLMAHTIRVAKLPFTPLIDTFIGPLFVYLLFRDADERRARTLSLLIHTIMLLNAAIGIVEFASGLRITPLVAAGLVIDEDWRSTALLGHPLANASLTGAYLLILALGGGRDLAPRLRPAAFLVGAAGMVVFGGRAATVLLLGMLAVLLALRLVRIARGERFHPGAILTSLVVLPIGGAVLVGLAEAGFFDLFIERFIDDKGSSEARTEMLELFKHIPLDELLLGPDARQIETLQSIYGLDFGIESFWVAYVLSNGLIVATLFFLGLMVFCREILGRTRPGGIWVLAFFFIVASTSVSLSAKSPLMAIQILMLLTLMRNGAEHRLRRA